MGISLKNAMKLGKLSNCNVIAGHNGLDKIIENVTVMDVPDVVKWLKGGELVLTSLFAIKDDHDAQNVLVQQLYYAGATALAIKPFKTIKTIPESIIKSANKFGFPIIQIPDDIEYFDILLPIMHYIFNKKVVLQEDIEQRTKILQEISIHSQGIEAFADHVSSIMKNTVTIESEFSFIDTPKPKREISPLSQDQKNELTIIKRPIRFNREYGGKQVPCIISPIIVDEVYFGNITCWAMNSDLVPMDLAILEKASSLLSIEFLKIKIKHDMELRYKNDFLRELLFNEHISDEDMVEWGAKYQLATNKKYYCMLVGDRIKQSHDNMFHEIEQSEINALSIENCPKMLSGMIRNKICIIVLLEERSQESVCREIYDHFEKNTPNSIELFSAVGEIYEGPRGIRKSFYQAEQAYNIMRQNKKSDEIVFHKDLGVYRFLPHLIGTRELQEFYNDTIGTLLNEDPKRELMYTLKVYFENNEVVKATSDELYIHVNTLKYRLKRIEQITGLNLKKVEDKVRLFIGLKIYELTDENSL